MAVSPHYLEEIVVVNVAADNDNACLSVYVVLCVLNAYAAANKVFTFVKHLSLRCTL